MGEKYWRVSKGCLLREMILGFLLWLLVGRHLKLNLLIWSREPSTFRANSAPLEQSLLGYQATAKDIRPKPKLTKPTSTAAAPQASNLRVKYPKTVAKTKTALNSRYLG